MEGDDGACAWNGDWFFAGDGGLPPGPQPPPPNAFLCGDEDVGGAFTCVGGAGKFDSEKTEPASDGVRCSCGVVGDLSPVWTSACPGCCCGALGRGALNLTGERECE